MATFIFLISQLSFTLSWLTFPMGGEEGVLLTHLLMKMLIKVNQKQKKPYMQRTI